MKIYRYRRWLMHEGERSAEKNPEVWAVISAVLLIPLFIYLVLHFDIEASNYPGMDMLLIAVVGYFGFGNPIRVIVKAIKKGKADGKSPEDDKLAIERKARILATKGPYTVKYMPKYDNLYLKLFADLDTTNIPDNLMMAFDYLEESKWQEADKIFSEMMVYSALPYPYFGKAMCELKINSVNGIAENKYKLMINGFYKAAVEIGGTKISNTIRKLKESSEIQANDNNKKTENIKTENITRQTTPPQTINKKASSAKKEIIVSAEEKERIDRINKLAKLSADLDSGVITYEEYLEMITKL